MADNLTANQERGYKAAISNPNVSAEAKAHAKEVLHENGVEAKDPVHVAAGLKAAINNPNTTEEGKEAAKEKLEKM